ncbi:unnamed protein product [Soboliphyme baturini]|uniref:Cullin domain-containing protein n=1 Tax=Soboliphyme baturini TaxID=241478 RepID=A0A183IY03_9BILA|nr:unnamed protein product [Soboliphyme baturini]
MHSYASPDDDRWENKHSLCSGGAAAGEKSSDYGKNWDSQGSRNQLGNVSRFIRSPGVCILPVGERANSLLNVCKSEARRRECKAQICIREPWRGHWSKHRPAGKRILKRQEDYSLLKTYVREWQKYYAQSLYLPEPFRSLEPAMYGSRSPQANPKSALNLKSSKSYQEESFVRKIMLETWNRIIFYSIKERLQAAAMRLVFLERSNEDFDAQLVVGVRQSFGNS